MSRAPLVLGCFVTLALVSLPAAAVRASDVPTTTTLRGQLRLLFKTWDLNDDGYLDRQELAKAFRGPKAKPYQAPPHAKPEDNKDNDNDKDKPEAKSPAGKGDKPDKADFAKYPDYVFLTELDADGDGKVSRKEFETWAHGYATELRQRLLEEERLLKAGAGSQTSTSAKTTAQMKQGQADAKKVENQVKAYDKLIQEELKKSQH